MPAVLSQNAIVPVFLPLKSVCGGMTIWSCSAAVHCIIRDYPAVQEEQVVATFPEDRCGWIPQQPLRWQIVIGRTIVVSYHGMGFFVG